MKQPSKQPDSLHGFKECAIFTILPSLDRNKTSMGNFMKKVCMDGQGLISKASFSFKFCLFKSPIERLIKSWAILTLSAMISPVVTFMALW